MATIGTEFVSSFMIRGYVLLFDYFKINDLIFLYICEILLEQPGSVW